MTRYTEKATGHDYVKNYTYDSSNRLTSATEKLNGNSRKITFTYDGDNRIATYKKGNISQSYTYDGFGRNSKKVVKNGDSTLLTTTNTFRTVSGNATGQVSKVKNTAASYDVSYTYTYDGNGNILSVSDGAYTTSYEYDESNQLIRENNEKENYTRVWVYNNGGNIRYVKDYPYTTAETLDTPDNTVTYTYGNADWIDQLTAIGDRTFTYDEIGNPLSDGKRTYTWEHGRQLATLTQNGATWTNTYNAEGLRTKRTDGTNTYQYYYAEGSLIGMTYNGDKLYFTQSPEGLPYNVEYKGTQYVYALNLQGDVMAILNTAGQAVVEYTYDAWGNILDITGSMKDTLGVVNPLRYRGYVYDNETQLYYLQSRYYDPEIGRFINADKFVSTGQGILGHNMYAYCGNNPVLNVDETGTRHEISAGGGGRRDVTEEIFSSLHEECRQIRKLRVVTKTISPTPPVTNMSVACLAATAIAGIDFYHKVDHGAPWDIKLPEMWKNTIGTAFPVGGHNVAFDGKTVNPEMLGNLTYGYLGYKYGIPLHVLYIGSYYAAGFPTGGDALHNEVCVDWKWITKGYAYAFGGY